MVPRNASTNGNTEYDVDAYVKMMRRNLFGGDGDCPCAPLKTAVETNDIEYIEHKLEPVIRVIVEERDQARRDFMFESNRRNNVSRALEAVYQNLGAAVAIRDPEIAAMVKAAIEEGRA